MRLIVLGSGAGGGIPQWNAANALSRAALAAPGLRRNQTSLAVTGDGEAWALINAAPELRHQIIATPALHPRATPVRNSPIAAVVLTGADVDQVAGLLTLRERQPFTLLAAPRVLETLRANQIFGVLADGVVTRRPLEPGTPAPLLPGLVVTAHAVPGKVALYNEDMARADLGSAPGDTIAVMVSDEATGRRALVMPSCAAITPEVERLAAEADVLFFDGTFFTDDEMITTGEGSKTASRMGHVPVDGSQGPLERLAGHACRRIFIHINNTNPMSDPATAQAARVRGAGWEIATDGMEIIL